MSFRTSLALLLMLGAAQAQAQIAGTYRIVICSRPCLPTDSGVVRGHIVLFPDTLRRDTLAPEVRATLGERARWLELRPGGFNACFSLPTGPTHIEGRELYAGIVRRSFTRWDSTAEGLKVILYQSPDAHYAIVGKVDPGHYSGRGVQNICCGYPDPPASFFLATRVGDPNIRSCL